MKLYLNKTSPYARLVVVVAHEKDLARRIENVWVDPWSDPPELLAANPYARVPALATDGGQVIVDSTCICEYLDGLGGRPLMPGPGPERERALARYGLGRGLIDAAFGVTIERRFNGSAAEPPLAERWLAALARALEKLERDESLLSAENAPALGDLAIAVGLSYIEFRLPELRWMERFGRLRIWHERVAGRASLRLSAPT